MIILVFEICTIILVFSFYVLCIPAMYLEQRECLKSQLTEPCCLTVPQKNSSECITLNELTRHREDTKMGKKGLPLSERLDSNEGR